MFVLGFQYNTTTNDVQDVVLVLGTDANGAIERWIELKFQIGGGGSENMTVRTLLVARKQAN